MFVTHGSNIVLIFWVAIAFIVAISTFFSYRTQASHHRMLEKLAEKGQPIPPELLTGGERDFRRYRNPIQSGIFLMCIRRGARSVFLGDGWRRRFLRRRSARPTGCRWSASFRSWSGLRDCSAACSTGARSNEALCSSHMSELERLAASAAQGDAAAFAALVRVHQGKLRAFLRRMMRGDRALADDLAQDTFLEAYRKIAQFRAEGTFASWLYQIGYSRYLMHARKRKLEALDETCEPSHESQAGLDAKLDLETALARIHPAKRAALTLCFSEGYSHRGSRQDLEHSAGYVEVACRART